MIRLIRRLLCRHHHRIRERVAVPGVPGRGVNHWVCVKCGDRVPVIDRATRDHLKALRTGHVRRLRRSKP